ncbi:MAG: M23 family metallopeptidase [Alphaproteobacteria bacterium]
MEFPLTGGTFFIAHGGANKNVNNHFPVRAQRYALDIMALNSFSTRAGGLLPDEPESYQIFGNDIVAPCTGEVIAIRADLEDQNAMVFDPENLLGNHIILFCQGNSILLAHLKFESVLVVVGDLVTAGQLIAQVGNTGNTSEPHLHIHAVKGWHIETKEIAFNQEPVAMTFGGKFLIRNDKFDN